MDKSIEAADAAERALREVKAALAASQRFTAEYDKLFFALPVAKRRYLAALRAEKAPRVNCTSCQRRLKPGEPMVWQWRYSQSVQVCLRCDRSEHKGERHADGLAGLDQQPCATCARPMYFDGFHPFHARRPLTCSYQCNYRRKVKRQTERRRVERATIVCIACGKMFTQSRRDAKTCSNVCRQRLFRYRHAAK